MSRLASLPSLAIFAMLLPVACTGSSSPAAPAVQVVTDTLGVKFSVSCYPAFCLLTPQDPSIKATSCDLGNGPLDAFVLVWDRIMRVHALRVPADGNLQFNSTDPGHPMICTGDADCQLTSYPFSCVAGLCQRADLLLTTNDVIALCQADIPWPTDCPYVTSQPFANRMVEVAATCGSHPTCATVPADCRQPTVPADGGGLPDIDAGF